MPLAVVNGATLMCTFGVAPSTLVVPPVNGTYAHNQPVANIKVWKGSEPTLKAGFTNDLTVAVPKGYASRVKSELVSQPRLVAPVSAGQVVGTLKVSLDGKPFGEYPVVAIEAVPVGNIFGRAIDTVRLWFN